MSDAQITTATAFIGENPIRTIIDSAGSVWYYAADAYKVLYGRAGGNVGRVLKKVCPDYKRMQDIAPKREFLNYDYMSTTLLVNEVDFMRLCLYGRTDKNTYIKNHILNQIVDFHEIFRALNSFEVPDDLPDLYVYAIKEVETGSVKLGISRDPLQRLIQLQTNNSQKLQLVASRKAVHRFADERALHKEAQTYHIHGEWFTEKAIGVIQ